MTTDRINNDRTISPPFQKLIRSVVHDLKNPLTVALGNMQLLQMRTTTLEDDNKQLVSNAIEAVYQQLGILDNIADCVKIVDGSLVFHPEDVNIDEILESEIEVCQSQEPSKKYLFHRTSPGANAFVDKRIMIRALSNILEHVRLNTSGESTILIASKIDKTNNRINIEIEDDGEYLLPTDFESIFELLSKTNLIVKKGRWDNGALLGFSIRLIRFMNGDMVAVYNGRKGAKFVISLPIASS